MHKSWLLYLLIGYFGGYAQVINIPDPNFKAALLAADGTNSIAWDCPINNYLNIDANNNDEIEQSEALAVCQLNIVGFNISDLTGIEYFTNLKILGCSNNNLNVLDVSQLVNLQILTCDNNFITSLDLGSLIGLKILTCKNNPITALDFSQNPLLERVYCNQNLLTSLHFGANPMFFDLGCANNPNLTDINIKNGVAQQFPPNTIYNECWTGCPSLSRICADSFELSALQTYLSDCGIATAGITFTTSCALNSPDLTGTVDEIKLYPNPNQGLFTVSFASPIDFGTVEVYSMVGQRLAEVSVHNADQVTIQLPHLAAGCYLVKVSSNGQTVQKRMIIE